MLVINNKIISLFIGCEFFRDFKENEYNADGLHFNWQQVKSWNFAQFLVFYNIDLRSTVWFPFKFCSHQLLRTPLADFSILF